MCGIAGLIDLKGTRRTPEGVAVEMARALYHRGPDEEGLFESEGIAMASRRLSIVGLEDGQQPVTNETESAFVVFNGELFDYVEQKAALKERGHTLLTGCDTEAQGHHRKPCREDKVADHCHELMYRIASAKKLGRYSSSHSSMSRPAHAARCYGLAQRKK